MLNNISKSSPIAPRMTLKPILALLKMQEKRRQREDLRNLDARALADIGMSEARRDAELRRLR